MRNALRKDWMPQCRAEVCACISVLAIDGKLTPDDEQHVADWIAFRRDSRAISSLHVPTVKASKQGLSEPSQETPT